MAARYRALGYWAGVTLGAAFDRSVAAHAGRLAVVDGERRVTYAELAALDMFGRSDSPNVPKFIHWGLKSVGNAEIRQAYKAYVDRKIEALGLDVPDERQNRRFL